MSGAVLMVLGALTLPLGGSMHDVLASTADEPGRWNLGAGAMLLASLGLSLGVPTVLSLTSSSTRRLGLLGAWVWSIGTIGLAGVAALGLGFQAVGTRLDLSTEEATHLVTDPGLLLLVQGVGLAFHGGELMVAVALLRARRVPLWAPTLMIVHAVTTPLMLTFPHEWRGMHTVLLGGALMGLAMAASETWATSRR
ncbi:MAG: hypothetical protein ACI379_04445 [Nocardioides sp.]|uniref:hypothetical protein n=1 Tax=Nocardioides sp. TaxID=35761 RepID=UPI003F0FC4E5